MCNSFHVSTLLDYSKAKNGDAVLIESGNRIANRRRDPNKKAGKLTQEQLAELLECSDRNVKKWENAKTPINSIKDLSALSEILECDIEYLTCQCDTLRKENQNAVELYGLSEKALMKLQEYSHSFFFMPFNAQVGLEHLDKLICNQGTFMAFLHLCNTYKYSYVPDRQDLVIHDDGSDHPRLPAEFSLDDTELSIVREQAFIKKLRKLYESDKVTIEKVKD